MTPSRITIHCSDSPDGKPVSVEEIRSWHLARGWTDIGYHFVIGVDGVASPGRALNVQGAHVEGENEGNVGICLVGNSRFSAAQWQTLDRLLQELQENYKIPDWEIYAHYEFPSAQRQGKTCPNVSIRRILAWYLGGKGPLPISPHLL